MSSYPSDDEQVVRARRLEILDGAGRVRAIVGELDSTGAPSPNFGLVLLDDRGQQRAWLSLGQQGPVLAFDESGNAAVEVGVNDAGSDALHVGAYLVLSDRTGGLSIGWWVEEDGSAIMRTGSPRSER